MAPPGATERQQPTPLSEEIARRKRAAAEEAALLVEDGMRVGLGTGTTVAYLLPALAARRLRDLRCVSTSPATERSALELGLPMAGLDELGGLDIAIDGADQIDPEGWLVKGGGGAHTREKIVAANADLFVVIASAEKAVAKLAPPVPVELLPFAVERTLVSCSPARLRDGAISPDGGLIGDYLGPVADPRELARTLSALPGVIEHGLFAPEMVSLLLIAGDDRVERRAGAKRS